MVDTISVSAGGGEIQSRLRRRMAWLLGLTFLHVVGEGGIALVEALRTGSLALLAFGLESVIEEPRFWRPPPAPPGR
jgi:hypothetical protein